MSERDFDLYIVVTVTGMKYQQNQAVIFNSKTVKLVKEPKNKFDPDAVAVYDEFGKFGYVANSTATMEKGSASASMLCKAMTRTVANGHLFLSNDGKVMCRVDGVFNYELVCERAIKRYNQKEFNLALSLFLKIERVFNTPFLLSCIADCYLKLKIPDKALKYANAALKKSSEEELAKKVWSSIKDIN